MDFEILDDSCIQVLQSRCGVLKQKVDFDVGESIF